MNKVVSKQTVCLFLSQLFVRGILNVSMKYLMINMLQMYIYNKCIFIYPNGKEGAGMVDARALSQTGLTEVIQEMPTICALLNVSPRAASL